MRILFQLNPYNQQRQREKQKWIFPIKLAMYATYLRNQGHEVVWDNRNDDTYDRVITSENQIDIPFLQLPHTDRILTNAFNPKWQNNGNFKYRPGVYIQSTSSCWWGKCSFCCEQGIVNEIREVNDVISEINECKELGAVEIFDDSATFPTGHWLDDFCNRLSNRVVFSANMRITKEVDFSQLKQCGFRMLLFGIESANQITLDKINKGVKVEDIIPTIKKASEAGLEPHIAVMFGYKWESDKDAERTLNLVHYLLRKGYAKTAQASYFRSRFYESNQGHRRFVHRIYNAAFYPDFWFNQIKDIKDVDDLKYLWRKIQAAL